jgi:hypothetical protein
MLPFMSRTIRPRDTTTLEEEKVTLYMEIRIGLVPPCLESSLQAMSGQVPTRLYKRIASNPDS